MAEASRPARRALHGVRVLVVDDDPDTREILGAILEAFGADTTFASDVKTAAEVAGAARFDVVISDLAMPGEDGVSLVRRLRPRYPDLPFIALSAFSMEAAGKRALEGGFEAYLSKPTDVNELVATVARACAQRSLRT